MGTSRSGGFQWIESYNGPIILNGPDKGLNLVGIGVTRPNWTLDVAGTIQGDSTPSAFNFAAPGVIGKSLTEAGVHGISETGPGIAGDGNIGVNARGVNIGLRAVSASPNGLAGQFIGNVRVTGNVLYSGSLTRISDARYKISVRKVSGALGVIGKLRGVTYKYNRDVFPK